MGVDEEPLSDIDTKEIEKLKLKRNSRSTTRVLAVEDHQFKATDGMNKEPIGHLTELPCTRT